MSSGINLRPSDARLLRRRRWARAGCAMAGIAAFTLGYWFKAAGVHWSIVQWAHATVNLSSADDIDLQTLGIDVQSRALEKLEHSRRPAGGAPPAVPPATTLVPARLTFQGRTVRALMGLTGDGADWDRTGEWGLSFAVRGDDHLLSLKQFTLQQPQAKGYLREWAFRQSLRREDVLAPRYGLVNVQLNGLPRGIHALEEQCTGQLLSAQRRREGVIVSPGAVEIGQADPVLRAEHVEAIGQLRAFRDGRRRPSDVFEVEPTARYMALTELWGADRALEWEHCRFYYDPVSARLEPIGCDGSPGAVPEAAVLQGLLWTRRWGEQLLEDPVLAEAYVRHLKRACDPEYVARLERDLAPEMQALRSALALEHEGDPALASPLQRLDRRREAVQMALDPARIILAYEDPGEVSMQLDARHVQICNALDLPVELLGIQETGGPFQPGPELSLSGDSPAVRWDGRLFLPPSRPGRTSAVQLSLPAGRSHPGRARSGRAPLTVHTRIAGLDTAVPVAVQPLPAILRAEPLAEGAYHQRVTLNQALARHPFLEPPDASGALAIKPGTWQVHEDLVVPEGYGLRAGPGTTLRFASQALLVVRGPLLLEGRKDCNVILEPLEDGWPGVVVLDSPRESSLEHAIIRGTRSIARRGWILTGGVTFHRSAVRCSSVVFEDSQAEDGLNIISAGFKLANCSWRNCSSDAFDGDFVTGTVENCLFENVGGDGVDTSGSQVVVRGTRCRGIGDKAVSAGEDSQVEVYDTQIEDVSIAIASKDHSQVRAEGVSISRVKIALAAYSKKKEFGPARIEADGAKIVDAEQQSMVQTGSSVRLNGVLLETADMDVKTLYAMGILGK